MMEDEARLARRTEGTQVLTNFFQIIFCIFDILNVLNISKFFQIFLTNFLKVRVSIFEQQENFGSENLTVTEVGDAALEVFSSLFSVILF